MTGTRDVSVCVVDLCMASSYYGFIRRVYGTKSSATVELTVVTNIEAVERIERTYRTS
jgi:hypothetical protein